MLGSPYAGRNFLMESLLGKIQDEWNVGIAMTGQDGGDVAAPLAGVCCPSSRQIAVSISAG